MIVAWRRSGHGGARVRRAGGGARITAFAIALSLLAPCAGGAQARPAAEGALPLDPTAAFLADVIRLDTSNPPGNEGALAEWLAPQFRALGFEVEIIPTPQEGKAHFIARLRGDGSKRPVLLAAHADVVGVEREKWTVDPFAGVVRDGYVYGRGAIDFKGGMAVFARAVMLLAERNVPLARDVIFLAEADEEGGRYGPAWLARDHWPKIDAEFALNEGGWIMRNDTGGVRYVGISTADKYSVQLVVTATGTSTHSSMPRPDNAIFALSRALSRIAEYRPPVMLTPATRKYFATLGRTTGPPMSEYIADLLSDDPERVRRADLEIGKDPLLHAMMRNTIAPVLMNAGFRGNVIPGSAEATINLRIIPGTDPSELVRALERVVNDPSVTLSVGGAGVGPRAPQISTEDTDLFRALVRQARVQWPEAEVTPYLFQAGTDAGAWRSRGVPVYGIYPYPIDAGDLTRMHGNDERVSIESLRQGTEMIYRTLVEVAGRR